MSLLSSSKSNRAILRCAFPIVVFLMLALPAPSPFQNRVGGIGPTAAWASSSPDETLNPPPTPTKKSARLVIAAPATSGRTITGRILFAMLWRAYWATVRL